MASASDIGEAEATLTTNRMTIYDCLGEGEEASPPSPETPPQLRLPRFTCGRIRFGRLGRERGGRGGRKEVAAAEKSEDASVGSSGARARDHLSLSSRAVDRSLPVPASRPLIRATIYTAGWKQAAAGRSSGGGGGSSVAAGQTGMGLSMLFLLARTCVELNRMAEVRAQMETLLKEIRDEASRVKAGSADHVVLVAPKTCNNLRPSSTSTVSSSCVSDTSTNCLEIRRGEDGEWTSEPEWKCTTERETPDQVQIFIRVACVRACMSSANGINGLAHSDPLVSRVWLVLGPVAVRRRVHRAGGRALQHRRREFPARRRGRRERRRRRRVVREAARGWSLRDGAGAEAARAPAPPGQGADRGAGVGAAARAAEADREGDGGATVAGHGHTGAGAAHAAGRTVTLRLQVQLACRTGCTVQLACDVRTLLGARFLCASGDLRDAEMCF